MTEPRKPLGGNRSLTIARETYANWDIIQIRDALTAVPKGTTIVAMTDPTANTFAVARAAYAGWDEVETYSGPIAVPSGTKVVIGRNTDEIVFGIRLEDGKVT